MAVLINFKICDNAEECNGVAVCKTGALSWDNDANSIRIDNDKCTSCGACEKGCEVYAISVAKDDAEYTRIKKEIDEDPRELADLYIDRYGAQPILPADLITPDDFEQHVLRSQKVVAAEFFKDDTIECMIKSVPIKKLLHGHDIKYRKVRLIDDKLGNRYHIEKYPSLLFFKQGELIGKIEGYYTEEQFADLKHQVDSIISD